MVSHGSNGFGPLHPARCSRPPQTSRLRTSQTPQGSEVRVKRLRGCYHTLLHGSQVKRIDRCAPFRRSLSLAPQWVLQPAARVGSVPRGGFRLGRPEVSSAAEPQGLQARSLRRGGGRMLMAQAGARWVCLSAGLGQMARQPGRLLGPHPRSQRPGGKRTLGRPLGRRARPWSRRQGRPL